MQLPFALGWQHQSYCNPTPYLTLDIWAIIEHAADEVEIKSVNIRALRPWRRLNPCPNGWVGAIMHEDNGRMTLWSILQTSGDIRANAILFVATVDQNEINFIRGRHIDVSDDRSQRFFGISYDKLNVLK